MYSESIVKLSPFMKCNYVLKSKQYGKNVNLIYQRPKARRYPNFHAYILSYNTFLLVFEIYKMVC